MQFPVCLRRLLFVAALTAMTPGACPPLGGAPEPRPNVLWLVAEDINPHLGCYGDPYATTPRLDRLAERSLRFLNCWSVAPVCAPARTAIISGMYPATTGAEHMRSEVPLPTGFKLFPQFLREAGYYCSNHSKEDYNLTKPGKVWDDSSRQAHWTNRAPGQPFFAVFNFETTHESRIRARPHTLQHDPARVRVPAYHPDHPDVRHDWAQYYDNLATMDRQTGALLDELEAAGLRDETIVFFYGDNGSGMPRSKRWPYNSGLNVPLLVSVPPKFAGLLPEGRRLGVEKRLVSFVDFAPTLLSIAGVKPPSWMQGHPFLGAFASPPPRYLFGARGRMDERLDLVRSVRNERFIYIRNYMPHEIYGQYLAYMFETPTTRVWKQLHEEGRLNPVQSAFWQPKPPEELYDLELDPDEVSNLASSAAHREIRDELQAALRAHLIASRDLGFLPEAEQHRLADGRAPYELGLKLPLEEMIAAAERAANRDEGSILSCIKALDAPESAVRYWGAMGLLIRGETAVRQGRMPLRERLNDPSPSVRIIAARALGQFGAESELPDALAVLKESCNPERHGAYAAVLALNAVGALGQKAHPILGDLKNLPTKDPHAPTRANDYVHRIIPELMQAR